MKANYLKRIITVILTCAMVFNFTAMAALAGIGGLILGIAGATLALRPKRKKKRQHKKLYTN